MRQAYDYWQDQPGSYDLHKLDEAGPAESACSGRERIHQLSSPPPTHILCCSTVGWRPNGAPIDTVSGVCGFLLCLARHTVSRKASKVSLSKLANFEHTLARFARLNASWGSLRAPSQRTADASDRSDSDNILARNEVSYCMAYARARLAAACSIGMGARIRGDSELTSSDPAGLLCSVDATSF